MSMSLADAKKRAMSLLTRQPPEATPRGITSVCSAHPLVIKATLARGKRETSKVLIEATCNQVNHEGGYTGMTPSDFRKFVETIAAEVGFPAEDLILGGDHLGPNPWKNLPAEDALAQASKMIVAFAEAGFTKMHLDTSMGCAGEPEALPNELTADRSARLAKIVEAAEKPVGCPQPVYIIGTEVPPPGGATELIQDLEVTSAAAAKATYDVHQSAFAAMDVSTAFERVIGLVVQPGVEFGNANVIQYSHEKARDLSASLVNLPGLVFEAHSTDYQSTAALTALVNDGFAILKVGPGVTFALREALYALDMIAAQLDPQSGRTSLIDVMENIMIEKPAYWSSHYPGSQSQQRLQRHFSYSDRIRYYWPDQVVVAAISALLNELEGVTIPQTLISQYFSSLYPEVMTGKISATPNALCIAAIDQALEPYSQATQ